MPHKIAVFDIRLLPEAKKLIQALTTEPIHFPNNRCDNEQEFINRTADADIVLISPWDKVTSAYLDACPAIRYIGLCGTSTANIDMDELRRRDIAFTNVVSKGKEAVAEFYLMQLVKLARGEGKYRWKAQPRELMGKSIGIIGLGHVGQAFAHLALAYKMCVSYYGPHRKQEWEDRGLQYLDKSELLQSSEILALCAPTNIQVLSKQDFNLIEQGSIIMQASGGIAFDEQAFLKWVEAEGNFAIFDRTNEEIYRTNKDTPEVICSEFVAGDTYEANERRGRRVFSNLEDYLQTTKSESV